MSRSACQVAEEGCHLGKTPCSSSARLAGSLAPSLQGFPYFSLHPGPFIFVFSLAVPPFPSPTSAPFFTLPPSHSNLRPRPQSWGQLLL